MVKLETADPLSLEEVEDKTELLSLATPKVRLEIFSNVIERTVDTSALEPHASNFAFEEDVTANGTKLTELGNKMCSQATRFFEIVNTYGYHKTSSTNTVSSTDLTSAAPVITHSALDVMFKTFADAFAYGYNREILPAGAYDDDDLDWEAVANRNGDQLKLLGWYCGAVSPHITTPTAYDKPELFRSVAIWTYAALWLYRLGMFYYLARAQSDMAGLVVSRLREGNVSEIIKLGKDIVDEEMREVFGYLVKTSYPGISFDSDAGISYGKILDAAVYSSNDIGGAALTILTDNQETGYRVPTWSLNQARRLFGYGVADWGGAKRFFIHEILAGDESDHDEKEVGYNLWAVTAALKRHCARFAKALETFVMKRHYSWDDLKDLANGELVTFKLSDLNGIVDPSAYVPIREYMQLGSMERHATYDQWIDPTTATARADTGFHIDLANRADDDTYMLYTTGYSDLNQFGDFLFLSLMFIPGEAEPDIWDPNVLMAAKAVYNRSGMFHSFQFNNNTSANNTYADWPVAGDQDDIIQNVIAVRRTYAPDQAIVGSNLRAQEPARRIFSIFNDKRYEMIDYILKPQVKSSTGGAVGSSGSGAPSASEDEE